MDSTEVIIVEKDPVARNKSRRSLMYQTNAILGICEQLRFIYDDVYTLPEGDVKYRMTERLVDAIAMAKRMMDRLNYLTKKYHDTTGHGGKNLIVLQNNHKRIRMRWARKLKKL
jgi:hypothetical protein